MQGTRPLSSTKKLARVIISSTFSMLDKARKVNGFVWKMDNDLIVHEPRWTSNSMRWWQS